jgi:hypothetical protein
VLEPPPDEPDELDEPELPLEPLLAAEPESPAE